MEQLVAPYVAALSAHAGSSPASWRDIPLPGSWPSRRPINSSGRAQGGTANAARYLGHASDSLSGRVVSMATKLEASAGRFPPEERWRIARGCLDRKVQGMVILQSSRLNPGDLTAFSTRRCAAARGTARSSYRRIGASYGRVAWIAGILFRTDQINGNAVLRDDDSQGWDSLFTRDWRSFRWPGIIFR